MEFKFEILPDYLRAELSGRETVEETAKFLRAAAAMALKNKRTRVLIVVRDSKPIFRVQEYQVGIWLKELAARPEHRVALVARDSEVQSAHDYVALLASQRGAPLRAFHAEPEAIEWLEEKGPASNKKGE